MFPKLILMEDTKAMRNGIIVVKPLLRHYNQGNNRDEYEAEACSVMRRKRDKTSTTKNLKRGVVRSLTIEKLKW